MATFASMLERVKQDVSRYLPETLIVQSCQDAGHLWRNRQFDPVTTLHLFTLQILHGNTAIKHLRHLAKRPVNPAAYCEARKRLPTAALEALLERWPRRSRGGRGRNSGAVCGPIWWTPPAPSRRIPKTIKPGSPSPRVKGKAAAFRSPSSWAFLTPPAD